MKTLTLSPQELAAHQRGATMFVVDVDEEDHEDITIEWVEDVIRESEDEDGALYKYTGWLGHFTEYRESGAWEVPTPYQPGDEVKFQISEDDLLELEKQNECHIIDPPAFVVTIKAVTCKQLKDLYPMETLRLVASTLGKNTGEETMRDFYQSTGREWDDDKWVWLVEVEG